MTLDFQEIQRQISELGRNAPEREKTLQGLRKEARLLLERHAEDLEHLQSKVLMAAEEVPTVRCARPESEILTAHKPLPEHTAGAVLLAADGSQIAPDRHQPVDYYLINVGVFVMRLGETTSPETSIRSQLFYGDDLYTETGYVSEGLVTLQRDLIERQILAELTPGKSSPVITLTDGPLELWGAKEAAGSGGVAFRKALDKVRDALMELHQRGATTAGYVDKPRADLVIRLLEIAVLTEADLSRAGRERSLRGVTDWDLFSALLASGERSAVFGLQSQSVADYTGLLQLHFFYLNVGRQGRPWLARVEIPRWVAADPAQLDLLHAALVQQCQALGSRPYPYALHRAHETALITRNEKDQLSHMIVLELRRRGVAIGDLSPKQAIKEFSRRRRT